MKIAVIIARILRGLVFVVFGSLRAGINWQNFGFRFGQTANTCYNVLLNPACKDYSRAS
jgi:hypothetical protein